MNVDYPKGYRIAANDDAESDYRKVVAFLFGIRDMNWYLKYAQLSPEQIRQQWEAWKKIVFNNFGEGDPTGEGCPIRPEMKDVLGNIIVEVGGERGRADTDRIVDFSLKNINMKLYASVDFNWSDQPSEFEIPVHREIQPGSIEFMRMIRDRYVLPLQKLGIGFRFVSARDEYQHQRERLYEKAILGPKNKPTGYTPINKQKGYSYFDVATPEANHADTI